MHTAVIQHDSSILLSLSLCVFSFLAVVSSPFSCPCTCTRVSSREQVDSICENTKNKTYMSTNPKEEKIGFTRSASCAYTEKFSVSKLSNFCPHVHPCMKYTSVTNQCDNEGCQNAQHKALDKIMRTKGKCNNGEKIISLSLVSLPQ